MELKILEEVENPLLSRSEIKFAVDSKITAARKELVAKIAALKNAKEELVVIKRVKQGFGLHKAVCDVAIYKNAEMLKKIEPGFFGDRTAGQKKAVKKGEKRKKEEVKPEAAGEKPAEGEKGEPGKGKPVEEAKKEEKVVGGKGENGREIKAMAREEKPAKKPEEKAREGEKKE